MPSISPTFVAIVIALASGLTVAFFAYGRSAWRLRGYGAIANDTRLLARAIRDAQIFRDGGDLVISGNFGVLPAIVRFSHNEHTPGLYLRLGAPVSFTLAVGPRSARLEGRAALTSRNPGFDARVAIRSDHPTQARMLLSSENVGTCLEQICCSANTLFSLSPGALELSELVIPELDTGRHVLERLAAMARLAALLEQMPGSHAVKVEPIQHEKSSLGLRLAITAGVAIAVLAIGVELRRGATTTVSAESVPDTKPSRVPAGVLPTDAPLILDVQRYRLATADELDQNAVAWLRSFNLDPSARVAGDFDGSDRRDDSAYLLVGPTGKRRLVLLINREVRYDADYNFVGVLARVPRQVVAHIKWAGRPPQEVEGDGLLVTLKPDDPSSGLVLFWSEGRIVSAAPANYQSIHLD